MLRELTDYTDFARTNWACIAFGVLMTFGSSLGQTYFVSVFNPFLREAFDLSHAQIGTYYSVGTLISAFCIVWVGKLLDTVPLRRFTLGVYAALAFACVFMVILPFGAVLAMGFFFLRFAGQGLMTQTGTTSISRRFDANRGKALGLTALGFSLGQAFLPVMAVMAAGAVGWRMAWLGFAGFALFVMLPLALWLLSKSDFVDVTKLDEGSPGDTGGGGSSAFSRRQWTRGEMIRDRRFYMLLPVALAAPFVSTGIVWNMALLASTKGWSLEWVAASLSASAIAQFIATLLGGSAVDRWSALRVMPFSGVPLALAMIALIFIGHPVGAFVIMTFFGLSIGISFTSGNALWAELYGIRHLGAIKSLMGSIFITSTAIVPVFMGLLSDAGVSLEAMAAGFCVAIIAAIGIALTVKPQPAAAAPMPAE